ncbi:MULTISPECIES: STAS domain-containing protein [unclassified Amycolatopsis]|uniref:STAS domain-containing protein n=1 Tax=unclassified Amycolatopsis TaxID=2618356 RepID=UPI001FF1140A|nr:STAS domain-containing protein [Amycolatopsis sp. FBCC-B4732]UOX91201.1 STAS domain-containing protein [Amycolatopsis sp. FBCC-B4732]
MHDIFRTVHEPGGLTATMTERPGGVRVVTLVGDIDAATVHTLDEALATGERVVVDLTRVAFLSCAGVRSLLQANDRTDLALVVGGHAVTRSLEATGADLVLKVHPRVGAALVGLTPEAGREA